MKILILILLTFITDCNFAQSKNYRTIENKAFTLGEKLTFNINYGFVTAGVAIMQIPKIKNIFGRKTYQIDFKVSTTSTFDVFYKVRDRYATYLDVDGLFPWRFEQHIREGKYSRDFSAFFDHRNGKVRTSEGSYDMPEYVQDMISAFYFVRTIDFKLFNPEDTIHLFNFYKDKTYPLDVIYRGHEIIEVDAGTFNCIIVEPRIKRGGLFKSEGSILVWLTDDEIKMPVKVKSKIVIGSVDIDLTKYEGIVGKLTSKIND